MAFQLLLRGQAFPLEPGSELSVASVDSLEPLDQDDIIARVTLNPNLPTVLGLTNLSTSTWTVIQSSMIARLVEPGKTIRLEHGAKITFGSAVAEIVDTNKTLQGQTSSQLPLAESVSTIPPQQVGHKTKDNAINESEPLYQKLLRSRRALLITVGILAALALAVLSVREAAKMRTSYDSGEAPPQTTPEPQSVTPPEPNPLPPPEPEPVEAPEELELDRSSLESSKNWSNSFKLGISPNANYPSVCVFTETDESGKSVADRTNLEYWSCRIEDRRPDGFTPVTWSDGKRTGYKFLKNNTGFLIGTDGEIVSMTWHNDSHKDVEIVVITHGKTSDPFRTWLPAPVLEP